MDIGDLIHNQLLVSMHMSLTSGLCYPSLITRLCMAVECVQPADSERLSVRLVITRTSLLHILRPARPRSVDKMDEDDVEEEVSHDDPMSVDEQLVDLSDWMADLAVKQKALRADFAQRQGESQRFEGWVASML